MNNRKQDILSVITSPSNGYDKVIVNNIGRIEIIDADLLAEINLSRKNNVDRENNYLNFSCNGNSSCN